jgi:hypothetical protein
MGRHPTSRSVRGLPLAGVLVLALAALVIAGAPGISAKKEAHRLTLASYELIGNVDFPTGYTFGGTTVGGLSSITYDASRRVYHALSDDQGTINPVRYYTLAIDLTDGRLDAGDIAFRDVTFLRDEAGELFVPTSLDPEGFVLARPGQLFMSSEGFASRGIDPFVRRFNLPGHHTKAVPVPEKFLPDGATKGVRQNLAFESLNVSPDRAWIYVGAEGALVQDGPAANVGVPSTARIVQYDLPKLRPVREVVYPVDPVAEVPVPDTAFRVNGLVELLPIDNAGTMLAMERSFSVGAGNTVRIHQIQAAGATDVSGDFALPASYTPVAKDLVLDVAADLGIEPDNLEGMAFGPPLPDGRLPLVLVSDNNFDPAAITQFIVLAVQLERVH